MQKIIQSMHILFSGTHHSGKSTPKYHLLIQLRITIVEFSKIPHFNNNLQVIYDFLNILVRIYMKNKKRPIVINTSLLFNVVKLRL